MLAELLGALGRFEAKPRTDSRIRTSSRATRIRIDEARSILVIHEPRKPLVLFKIREVWGEVVFFVPCFGDGEELVDGGDCFEVVWVDFSDECFDVLKLEWTSRCFLLVYLEAGIGDEFQVFSCFIYRVDPVGYVNFGDFEGEVEWL